MLVLANIIFLPLYAILKVPLMLLRCFVQGLLLIGGLLSCLMFLFLHSFGSFAAIWMCGAGLIVLCQFEVILAAILRHGPQVMEQARQRGPVIVNAILPAAPMVGPVVQPHA